jgi:cyclic-di-GMP-binding protein
MSAEAQAVGSAGAALQFSDATSFRAWLERLPHGDLVRCHAEFATQVQLLAHAALRPSVRLDLLELMRETVADVQRSYGGICWGRPVPLDAGDRAIWRHVVGVWRDMAAAYDSLIIDMANGADEIAARAHLVCQRALRYTGLAIGEHNRVYHAVSGGMWRQLHRLYVFAENAGVTMTSVHDPVGRSDPATTCAATYIHTLLAQLAQPDALTLHQMNLLDRWLDRWERLVALSADPPPESTIPALAVDLAAEKGVGFARELPAAGVRHLRLEPLSKMLRELVASLRQGQTPAEIGLGDLPRIACENFLLLLYIQWCAAGTGRMDRRVRAERKVMIFPSLPSIHFHLAGQSARPSATRGDARALDSRGKHGAPTLWSEHAGAVETWMIVNQSVSGLLGLCRESEAGTGITHAQLFGVRAPGDHNTHLGVVQRLIVDGDGAIWVGLRLLPGAPQPAAARIMAAASDKPADARIERALMLPADTTLKSPATIVLPPTWYRANRVIELHDEKAHSIRLLALADRGTNFERATYMASTS